jgi:hypothetical protein
MGARRGRPARRNRCRPALVDRANLVLQQIESRNASLAALQRMRIWHSSVFQFAALACFLMGWRRTSSPIRDGPTCFRFPFIGIVAWNFAIYVLPLRLHVQSASPSRRRCRQGQYSGCTIAPSQGMGRRQAAHRGHLPLPGPSESRGVGRHRAAHQAAAAHLRAAWAAGLAASFLAPRRDDSVLDRWESSLLNAEGLHWLLNLIFIPISVLLPVQPFTLAEVQAMGYATGGGSLADHATAGCTSTRDCSPSP